MAIIDADGFETGVAIMPNFAATGGTFSSTTGRDGVGKAIRTGTSSTGADRTIVSGSDTIYVGWAMFIETASALGPTTATVVAIQVYADTGAVAHITINWDSSGHALLRRGLSNGTTIQTSTLAISTGVDQWYWFEAKVTIHDTTGEVIFKVNGVEFLNFTGDTKNAGTSTRPDKLHFGIGNTTNQMDDYICCDTTGGANNSWPGEVSIVGVRPAGNGANSGLTGSDGNQVNNYQQVDETVLDAADYNGSATATNLDTYDMTAVGKTGTVLAVQELAYAAKSDAGAKSFKHVQRGTSAGTVKSSAVALSTTYAIYAGPVWLTDGDGNAWTVARVDASEFGFEVA